MNRLGRQNWRLLLLLLYLLVRQSWRLLDRKNGRLLGHLGRHNLRLLDRQSWRLFGNDRVLLDWETWILRRRSILNALLLLAVISRKRLLSVRAFAHVTAVDGAQTTRWTERNLDANFNKKIKKIFLVLDRKTYGQKCLIEQLVQQYCT